MTSPVKHRPQFPVTDDYEAMIAARVAHMRLMLDAGMDIVTVAEKIWGEPNMAHLIKEVKHGRV